MSVLRLKATALSILILAFSLGIWHFTTRPDASAEAVDPELAALLGPSAQGESQVPGPVEVGGTVWELITDPFYDNGPNDQGVGWQLLYSLERVMKGFGLAILVALPLGLTIGSSRLMHMALDPFIQILKPISPLAWMPLALYTIKDSGQSSVFVIFICSVWPMMLNTAFGVASVRREWINVARTHELGWFRRSFEVILPAAAPTILTGMKISMGIAWLVIIAAEMLTGNNGIGYIVWNEWNNLSLRHVISAVLFIGVVGLILDRILAGFGQLVTYRE